MSNFFQNIFKIILLIFILFPNHTLANTWYYTNNTHPSINARYLQSSFSGSNNTYSITANFTGERRFTNGTTTNRWATASFGSNVTIPAGTWTFSIYGNSTSTRLWYPRIKIYNSTGTLIYTSTSPNAFSGTTYTTISWTDSVPAFSVGTGQYYQIEVWDYHVQSGNRTDRFRVNAGVGNFIIDTYTPAVYTPKTRSWRFYDDHSPATPTISYASENTTPANMYNRNNIRLRISIAEIGGASQIGRKKLQFSTDGINFIDVGEINSGSVWAYCDGGGSDDNLVPSLLVSTSDTTGPYVESGTATSTYNHTANQSAEFDYCLTENFAFTNSTYYFRTFDNTTGQIIYPDSGYNNPSITISNHGLNLTVDPSFTLNTINMDDAPGPTTGTFNNLFIGDYTGTLAGWSAIATATDFSDGVGNSITIDNLTMNTTNIIPILAESTSGIILGNGTLSTTTPLNIATATANNGAGNFNINGNFSLYIPIATVPGNYTSILTITIS